LATVIAEAPDSHAWNTSDADGAGRGADSPGYAAEAAEAAEAAASDVSRVSEPPRAAASAGSERGNDQPRSADQPQADSGRADRGGAAVDRVHSVLIVGTGLIGASVGLALRAAGVSVWLEDKDPSSAELAAALGAGTAEPPDRRVDVVLLAVPPAAVPDVLTRLQSKDVGKTYTDVSSVKSQPLDEIDALGANLATFVGGHPMAGRERSGPIAARADLFVGRPWVLTPTATTAAQAVAAVAELATLCRATPVTMSPETHDAAVALVSHAPHVVAALMAARLTDAAEPAVALAGTGVADVTRVAAGDWRLWSQILTANASAVATVLEALRDDLDAAIRALREGAATTREAPAADVVAALLRRGAAGRSRLPGKHGGAPTTYAVVPVLVPDRPGELARLFRDAGTVGVNVEDVAIEHTPGVPYGLVELSVQLEAAQPLTDALRSAGWSIQP
jgi:prephenate dehydrogenase